MLSLSWITLLVLILGQTLKIMTEHYVRREKITYCVKVLFIVINTGTTKRRLIDHQQQHGRNTSFKPGRTSGTDRFSDDEYKF